MHSDNRRDEAVQCNRLFNPKNNIVARASVIISEIVVEAQFLDQSRSQELDGLVWPIDAHPSFGSHAFVVQEYSHKYEMVGLIQNQAASGSSSGEANLSDVRAFIPLPPS
jgi:hypothetical protein